MIMIIVLNSLSLFSESGGSAPVSSKESKSSEKGASCRAVDFAVDYAKSSYSKCRLCEIIIRKVSIYFFVLIKFFCWHTYNLSF